MPHSAAQSDPYALWKSANYALYALSWFLITFSRRVEFIAVGAYVARWSPAKQAAFALGMIALGQAVPILLLAIPGGQLADRFNRHKVMLLSYSLGIASAGGMLAVSLVGRDPAWYSVFFSLGAVGWALGGPARQAMLPSMIPPALFSNGVAWNSTVFSIAMVTGPIAGGLMLVVGDAVVALAFASAQTAPAALTLGPMAGLAPAFALSLVCRILAVAAIAGIRYRPTNCARNDASWRGVAAGIRFVWRTKPILASITLDMFAVMLGGAVYLVPIYAEKILHVGALGLGALLSADAVGAICMAVYLAHRPPLRRAGHALLWAVAGFGVATIGFGLSRWFWLSLGMMFLIGALDNISVVVRHTLVQMLTPDEMRGRVSAVNGVFITASNELGGMESGFTAALFGPVASVVGGGVGTILVVLGAMRLWPQLGEIGALDSLQPADEERGAA